MSILVASSTFYTLELSDAFVVYTIDTSCLILT